MANLSKTFGLFGPHYSTTSKQPQSVNGKQRAKLTISLLVLPAIVLMVMVALPSYADPNFIWDRAAYWDMRYPTCFTSGRFMRDALEFAGYKILDANQLKTWMDARIADGVPSVVVFCHDIAPDTVVESMSSRCMLRRYLDAGGKIVWYADIPMYYQGHSDGTRTGWGPNGSINILGFNAEGAPWDSEDEVAFTREGLNWGLTETWQSERPTSPSGLRVLAKDNSGYAAAWVKHYVQGDNYRGFVRLFDRGGVPNFNDVQRVAEYPHRPEPIVFDNQAESEDDIIGVFFYPWYRNLDTSGFWFHWEAAGCIPPVTWPANYIPNYPDSSWNPRVQLYDNTDTEVLRWQDKAMARAGIDIAVASWWGIGGYEDAAFAKAIRTCKSVQWCIYYEMEAYSDPTTQKIYDDIKYVVDTYGPTRNYAKIDGKWLVLVYGAGGEEAANRWRDAKTMLAADGYNLYLNGNVGEASSKTAPDPWDSIHPYCPIIRQGFTDTLLPYADDSAWISPGFWAWVEDPRLERSLSEFTSAWNNIVAHRESYRFILIETWNEWHEGTQIEPGQEIVPDPSGYYPAGYDYGYDFIDAIAPAAINELHWKSSGHRPVPPVRFVAEEMIWEEGVLAESPSKCRIPEEDIRIGSSIFVPNSNDVTFTIRAKSVLNKAGRLLGRPELVLYLDDAAVCQWEVQSLTYQDYSSVASLNKGIHKVEVGFDEPTGSDWDIIVDFVDVIFTTPQPAPTPPTPANPLSEALDTALSFTNRGRKARYSPCAWRRSSAAALSSSSVTPQRRSTSAHVTPRFSHILRSWGKMRLASSSRSACMSRNVEDTNTRITRSGLDSFVSWTTPANTSSPANRDSSRKYLMEISTLCFHGSAVQTVQCAVSRYGLTRREHNIT